MIFNKSQRTVKLNPAWDVLKFMCKSWNIIVMQMQYSTAVEKPFCKQLKHVVTFEIDPENPV